MPARPSTGSTSRGSDGSTIQGLVIQNFTAAAIDLSLEPATPSWATSSAPTRPASSPGFGNMADGLSASARHRHHDRGHVALAAQRDLGQLGSMGSIPRKRLGRHDPGQLHRHQRRRHRGLGQRQSGIDCLTEPSRASPSAALRPPAGNLISGNASSGSASDNSGQGNRRHRADHRSIQGQPHRHRRHRHLCAIGNNVWPSGVELSSGRLRQRHHRRGLGGRSPGQHHRVQRRVSNGRETVGSRV